MSKSSSSSSSATPSAGGASSTTPSSSIKPDDYAHSPFHYAVALGDGKTLSRLLSSLPRLADPGLIRQSGGTRLQEALCRGERRDRIRTSSEHQHRSASGYLLDGVQVAIPVVPTVRVVITFTKFVELQPTERFYTPLSSPRHLNGGSRSGSEEDQKSESFWSWPSSSSSSSSSTSSSASWLRRNSSRSAGSSKELPRCPPAQQSDPFVIPSGYSWSSIDDKSHKMKKSKSVRKSKS
ncbi:hypothetical protein EUGRSUZ_L01449 [Eucalyptus grandis]|uniref:Ankyrin repeat domain-containing protein n=3 Tax=Eucalyptus grandis TaxID=71139 RepID=A0AAD9TAK3_EUCGR|nr:hypothetical protein EUGRSUZ_L01449 [Eucalyptus grandis]